MKEQIESALIILVGQPLVSISRAANMGMLHFGKIIDARHGKERSIGEFALHIQCVWRIVRDNEIVVGQRDMYYPSGDPDLEPDGWTWDEAGANRFDERAENLIAEQQNDPLIVQTITADYIGGLNLTFSKDFSLQVFPDDSLGEEFWRFLNCATDESHFVVSGVGVESA